MIANIQLNWLQAKWAATTMSDCNNDIIIKNIMKSYRTHGTFDSDFNLAVWRICLHPPSKCTNCLHSSIFIRDLDSPCHQTKYPPIYITYQFAKLELRSWVHGLEILSTTSGKAASHAVTMPLFWRWTRSWFYQCLQLCAGTLVINATSRS